METRLLDNHSLWRLVGDDLAKIARSISTLRMPHIVFCFLNTYP
jgi:hypothetical protein